jgi:hypothetical protein
VRSPLPQPYIAVHATATITATLREGIRILATLPAHPDGCPNNAVFAGKEGQKGRARACNRCNRHCSLIACRPERRILGQKSRNGGPKLFGANPAVIREKRRLFQR